MFIGESDIVPVDIAHHGIVEGGCIGLHIDIVSGVVWSRLECGYLHRALLWWGGGGGSELYRFDYAGRFSWERFVDERGA